jgi:hypothetical protein
VVRRIHERSARGNAPFVEINCASLSSQFVESELFGHEKGAFTDAKQAKRGLLEVAGRGSVFLDEIAELAPEVQPKLLKAIEERSFRRLGGTATLHSDARVLVATHVPLAAAVEAGRFRADLFYRLQVLTIALPALRERRGDIPALARSLLPRGATLSDAALAPSSTTRGRGTSASSRTRSGGPRSSPTARPSARSTSGSPRRPPSRPRRPTDPRCSPWPTPSAAPSTPPSTLPPATRRAPPPCSASPARRSTRSCAASPRPHPDALLPDRYAPGTRRSVAGFRTPGIRTPRRAAVRIPDTHRSPDV